MAGESRAIPVVDIGTLGASGAEGAEAVATLTHACREVGFFYAAGHGVDESLQQRLERASHDFFALDAERKLDMRMERGGRAWRGYFPVGAELTLGVPDQKEGIYFGAELDPADPRVRDGLPLHGSNLFPAEVPELRDAVLQYMEALTVVGHALVAGIAASLGLDPGYFERHYTQDPFILFRIFHYPALAADDETRWSVGEHTDYGLITILRQDDVGGLQVRSGSPGAEWLDVPPRRDAFVCNIGDMLDRMTGGRYRSTPHRVRNTSGRSRLSFPFFFDPNFDARIEPIERPGGTSEDRATRWDGLSVYEFEGTYGEYLLDKVSRVFPDLSRDALRPG